ncbi:glycosyltransferase family 39 protein [Micromonospora andamanensis]
MAGVPQADTEKARPSRASLPPFAYAPVAVAAAVVAVALMATASRYGYHRDELYFRVLGFHPSWGYVDQPPGTPLLARASVEIFGDSLWGLRVPAMLATVGVAVLLALVAREVGAGRWGQGLAAVGAAGTFPLVFGHVLLTATVDMVAWVLVLLFAMRALLRQEPRWWLAVGAVVGVSLWFKLLVVLLLAVLAVALLLVGPRSALASRWLWAGALLALALGSPMVAYQVVNDFPQLTMAQALQENKGEEARILLVPFQLSLVGLTLVPIFIAGMVALVRRPALRPVRALAVGYGILLVVMFLLAAQPYYSLGLFLTIYAVGAARAEMWSGTVPRRVALAAAVVVNVVAAVAFALPVFSIAAQAQLGITEINQATRDQIGWPEYTRQVTDVVTALPPQQRASAVVITSNYGEYGALHRYGSGLSTARLYSGHNELHRLGSPPERARVAVLVGFGEDGSTVRQWFASCEVAEHLDHGLGVGNEEQGRPITVCRDPRSRGRCYGPGSSTTADGGMTDPAASMVTQSVDV